ncbi:MAG TPA: TMEM175 family protein [Magnetospirillaceae bacterium]
MEAFSDGVFAIIITIMVLELKVPHGADWAALEPLLPVFLSYVLSFVYVGIYWNNHHHMLHATEQVNGAVLWANLHILFWLSLIPFATGWLGENQGANLPTAVYGAILFMAAIAYVLLQRSIIAAEGESSLLKKAVGKDTKGIVSQILLVTAIPVAFVEPWASEAIYVLIALIWLIPDRRIERTLRA